jgi:RNA polymerase sigma factor (TIGR02999 family)
MTPTDHTGDVTRLLNLAARGDRQASAALLPIVYDELRKLAHARMRKLRPGQTLQPTALVHEAYLKIAERPQGFEGRAEFFFVAARAMKDILVDEARRKAAQKRGGDRVRVEIDELSNAAATIAMPADDMLHLDRVLERLESEDAAGHKLVMLRYFTGLTMPEVAEATGMSLSSAERKWRFTRAWLSDALTELR